MFSRLGTQVAKHWVWVIIAWVVLAIGLKQVAPAWNEVTLDGDLAHLPEGLPSGRGKALLNDAFPDRRAKSQVVLIVERKNEGLRPTDVQQAEVLAKRFRKKIDLDPQQGGLPILDVWTEKTPVVGPMLRSGQSKHGQATLVVLQLKNEFMATDNVRVLDEVERELEQVRGELSPGLEVGVTGSAAIGGDMFRAASESIKNTERFTIVLVLLILLLVYRAPLLALIPLLSIAVSLSVATDLISMLTQVHRIEGFDWWTFRVFKTTKIFLVVILFGAGTDYCLFLISRYKEELSSGRQRIAAAGKALGGVSRALAASALTTVLGLGMMYFADFGKYSNSGIALALALTVALAACLTLAPALLVAFGKGVFWPFGHRNLEAAAGRTTRMLGFWEWISRAILARPVTILAVCVVLMAPFAYLGTSVDITYDLLSELGADRTSVRGTAMLRKHFSPGQTGPVTVLAKRAESGFEERQGRIQIAELTKTLYDLDGVTGVRSVSEPTGERPGDLQLFTIAGLKKLVAKPHSLTKANFVTQAPGLKGRVARFDVVMDCDPFSSEALSMLDRVEEKLNEVSTTKDTPWYGTQFEVAGTTAAIRDLKSVTQSDRQLISRLVVIAVLAVLLVLLRRPLICFYLIVSVLGSYFVTMGVTELLFQTAYGSSYHGLDWKLPLFLFVILIAIGQDYNIYLVTRVFEEQDQHGPREGLHRAVVLTGGIITSCGVIMAGTFVSMMSGSLRGMLELGFALSFGVLLDTFVVRPILVPAFLVLIANRQEESVEQKLEKQPAASPSL